MFNNAVFRKFAVSVLAFLAIAGGKVCHAGVISIGTGYHVEIDTSTFSGKGWLDLSFIPGQLPAAGATAYLSNFRGAFGPTVEQSGDIAGSLLAGLTFGNSNTYNDYFRQIQLGGKFGFDVLFSGTSTAPPGASGTNFNVGLLDKDFGYLGNRGGNLLEFALTPPNGGGVAWDILASVRAPGFATVGPVPGQQPLPEPGTLLLMTVSVAAMGIAIRRRRVS